MCYRTSNDRVAPVLLQKGVALLSAHRTHCRPDFFVVFPLFVSRFCERELRAFFADLTPDFFHGNASPAKRGNVVGDGMFRTMLSDPQRRETLRAFRLPPLGV